MSSILTAFLTAVSGFLQRAWASYMEQQRKAAEALALRDRRRKEDEIDAAPPPDADTIDRELFGITPSDDRNK